MLRWFALFDEDWMGKDWIALGAVFGVLVGEVGMRFFTLALPFRLGGLEWGNLLSDKSTGLIVAKSENSFRVSYRMGRSHAKSIDAKEVQTPIKPIPSTKISQIIARAEQSSSQEAVLYPKTNQNQTQMAPS